MATIEILDLNTTLGSDAGLTPAQLDDFERIQSGFGSLGNVENASSVDFTIPRTDLGNSFGNGRTREGLVLEKGRKWPKVVGGLGIAAAYSFGGGDGKTVYAEYCYLYTNPDGSQVMKCDPDSTVPTVPKPTTTTLPNQIIDVDGDSYTLTFNPNTDLTTVDSLFGIEEVDDASKGYGEVGYNLLLEMMRMRGIDVSTLPAEQQEYIMDVGYTITPIYFDKFLPDLFANPVITIPEISKPESTPEISTGNQQTGSGTNGGVTPTTLAEPTPESNNSSNNSSELPWLPIIIAGAVVATLVTTEQVVREKSIAHRLRDALRRRKLHPAG